MDGPETWGETHADKAASSRRPDMLHTCRLADRMPRAAYCGSRTPRCLLILARPTPCALSAIAEGAGDTTRATICNHHHLWCHAVSSGGPDGIDTRSDDPTLPSIERRTFTRA